MNHETLLYCGQLLVSMKVPFAKLTNRSMKDQLHFAKDVRTCEAFFETIGTHLQIDHFIKMVLETAVADRGVSFEFGTLAPPSTITELQRSVQKPMVDGTFNKPSIQHTLNEFQQTELQRKALDGERR
jgi:hypothetical protein